MRKGLNFEQGVGSAERGTHHELRAVVDRNPGLGPPFVPAVMGMAVDDGPDIVEAVDGVGEARGAEVGIDADRLALERFGDRRIVEHGDRALGTQRPQRVLELAGLVDGDVDERLDLAFAKGRQLAAPETADEPLVPAKPTPSTTIACSSSTLMPAWHRISATFSGWPHS